MVLRRLFRALHRQRRRGRHDQPHLPLSLVLASWVAGGLAIALLALLSLWSGDGLVVAPFGASAALLFGYPQSPLAQPRNLVLGTTLVAQPGGDLLGSQPAFVVMPVGSCQGSEDPAEGPDRLQHGLTNPHR